MFKDFNIASRLILEEAGNRSIIITRVFKDLAEMNFNGHIEYLCAQSSSKTDAVARRICMDKKITKMFLESSSISVAKGEVFTINQLDEAKEFLNKNKAHTYVVKPLSGRMGKNIFLDVDSTRELNAIWEIIRSDTEAVMFENQFSGDEYRVTATREEFLGATKRIPANVVGDGVNTIDRLIEQKNSDPRRSDNPHDPIVKIVLDETALFHLKQSGLSRNHIPKKDESVFIRKNSNLSTGGDSIDVTDIVHESVKKIAVTAVNAIPGLAYAGVDIMCKDVTKEQKPKGYIVIEVNSSPGIDMHHFPYSGKPRNVAKGIVDVIFPETKTD